MTDLPFIVVDFEQGTEAWRSWRRGGIGASDAPAIMGENPWKSARVLANDKLARKSGDWQNAAMAAGNKLEPLARQKYIYARGIFVKPLCLQSKTYDWMRASLDGICLLNSRVVEIKCGKSAYAHAEKHGTVPRYYVGQLQHILAITGYGEIDFCCYYPGESMIWFTVPRDNEYISRLVDREQNFWTALQSVSL
jgi:putative phage-type endonuclease